MGWVGEERGMVERVVRRRVLSSPPEKMVGVVGEKVEVQDSIGL